MKLLVFIVYLLGVFTGYFSTVCVLARAARKAGTGLENTKMYRDPCDLGGGEHLDKQLQHKQ